MTSVNELRRKTAQLPPVDESVKLPAAIRAASQRASEMHASVYQSPDTQKGEDKKKTDVPQPEGAQPEKQEPEKQEPEKQEPEDKDGGTPREPQTPDAQKQPDAKARQEGAGADAQKPTQPDQPEDWEHKYKSLKPRFDRQAQQISDLNGRLAHFERLFADMQKQSQKPQQVTPDLTFKDITPEERETYGEDFLDVAARAAQARLTPEVATLKAEIAKLNEKFGSVENTTKQTVTMNMYDYLDREQSNWRELNRNPEFIDWTNQPDPFSGVPRIKMLREAFDNGDAPRVLNFFKGFLKDEAATGPANVKPETPPNQGKVPLADLAAPGRAKAPAATTPPGEKETITSAQIAAFYSDVNRGKYRGNEAEKERIERMIFEAQAEGRIV